MITRWICEKDNKKWIYPIKKCVYCRGKITKQVSVKAKIIGVTKVNIPSPMHPVIPYYVLLLEDEYGNRLPKKTMKKRNIGEEYSFEKAREKNAVIVQKVKYDLSTTIRESFDLLSEDALSSGDKVIIKVSIIEPAYSYHASATSAILLDELISYFKEKGVEDIIIAEQCGNGNDTMASAKKCGILGVAKKYNVPFKNLETAEYVKKTEGGIEFSIAKDFFERKVINVPVLKTHSQLGICGGVENLIRAVDAKTQVMMFDKGIEKTLPLLLKILPSCLIVGDGTIGLQGLGPTFLGEPAFLNMILLSYDPVALDTAFCRIGVFDLPPYLKEADRMGVGYSNLEELEVIGDELEACAYPLSKASPQETAHSKIKLINGGADPKTFHDILKITAKLHGVSGSHLYIAIGNHITKEMAEGKTRIFSYGEKATQRLKELEIPFIAEIKKNADSVEKIMLVKSVLEDAGKKSIHAGDKLKAKVGSKIKRMMG